MAGKCLLYASAESSPQNTFTIRRVACDTGSEISPPGGDTAPITESDLFFLLYQGIPHVRLFHRLCQTGTEVCRVTFLTRHLLQTS